MAKVLILCPTFDHADALFASIGSVRAQSFTEWEMVVIGDGAPERTRHIVGTMMAGDPRIDARWHPKSVRYGEIYRDPAIRESAAEFICHLSDDDIWTPGHLAQMVALLEQAGWVNQAPLKISRKGSPQWQPVNHGTPAMRAAAARYVQLSAGLNYVAYRRETYLALPEGWTCAPWEVGASDVHMWAKFMRQPGVAVASSAASTALKFPSRTKVSSGFTPEQRLTEIAPWLARAAIPGLADQLRRDANVLDRMIGLFCVHATGECTSPQAALEKSGLQPAPEDATPAPALNGQPMLLPLSARQDRQVRQAWALVRAYVGAEGGTGEAREFIAGEFAKMPGAWTNSVRQISRFAGADAGARGARHCCSVLHDFPQAQQLKKEMGLID